MVEARNDEHGRYYPVFLDLRHKPTVVVGGGEVAERKVKGLRDKGAMVTIISPSLTGHLEAMAERGEIRVHRREYRDGDVEGAIIAIAATDDKAVNHRVAREGSARGVLVNVVDDAEHSDFILPSVAQKGDVVLAISTSGRSPALARKLRTELQDYLEAEIDEIAILLSEVRQELKKQGKQVDGDSWQKHIDLPLLQARIKQGKSAEAKDELIARLSG
ncbi:MAG: bifunctional precorrin-2 dehydrogenase/sirohydrochlorin ferrochelatase [Chloroflexi bacterium]|nr:bifunctional precorrin-2 dehydrogenase/sirohydrochlorin ferrochelatase [Chloroflexota bacterium]